VDSKTVRSFGSAAVSTLVLAWLAAEVTAGHTAAFDAAVRNCIHSWASAPLTAVMWFFTGVGSGLILFLLAGATVAVLERRGERHKAWTFAIAMAGALLLEVSLKLAIHRVRPVPFFGIAPPESYSFPSGHALLSFTFFAMLAALIAPRRALAWIVAIFLIAMIGLSRIYLGVHYPTDVIGGYLTGLSWVSVLYFGDRLRNS
jgi:membrane-associated phospholipid phosphatase